MQLNWPDCAWVAQHTAVGIQPKGTKHPITGAAAFRKMKAWSSTELNMGKTCCWESKYVYMGTGNGGHLSSIPKVSKN